MLPGNWQATLERLRAHLGVRIGVRVARARARKRLAAETERKLAAELEVKRAVARKAVEPRKRLAWVCRSPFDRLSDLCRFRKFGLGLRCWNALLAADREGTGKP